MTFLKGVVGLPPPSLHCTSSLCRHWMVFREKREGRERLRRQPPGDYAEWITAENGCLSFKLPGGVHFSPSLIVRLCVQDRFRRPNKVPSLDETVWCSTLWSRWGYSGSTAAMFVLDKATGWDGVPCVYVPKNSLSHKKTDPLDNFQTNQSCAHSLTPQYTPFPLLQTTAEFISWYLYWPIPYWAWSCLSCLTWYLLKLILFTITLKQNFVGSTCQKATW